MSAVATTNTPKGRHSPWSRVREATRSMSPTGRSQSDRHLLRESGSSTRSMDDSSKHKQVPEMTPQEEQEIYREPSLVPKRTIFQKVVSMRKLGGNNSMENSKAHASTPNLFMASSSLGNNSESFKLQSSYSVLEEEYCKLKLQQTELVALADHRKLEKTKSNALLSSLEQEIVRRRKENAEHLRKQHDLEQRVADLGPPIERVHSRKIQPLFLKRDLAALKLQEVRDALITLKEEASVMLDSLKESPDIAPTQVDYELAKQEKELAVAALEQQLELMQQKRLQRDRDLKMMRHNSKEAAVIGTEIVVDDHSKCNVSVDLTDCHRSILSCSK